MLLTSKQVKVYPRISIDEALRVRELSHSMTYELLCSAKKRMEKHIPQIVGAWLAGTYDRDRPVARAANDGISSFLDTDDKVIKFWRRCQTQILDYCTEAINETAESLSDERSVSPDSAEAKYYRVIGASVSLLLNLLLKLATEDFTKFQDKYEGFWSEAKKLWGFVSCKDAFVRRSVSQLLIACLEKQPHAISDQLTDVSRAFIADGLHTSHLSSSLQYVRALTKLTKDFPDVWTSAYTYKKSAFSRLRGFIEKGSHSGPPDFWDALYDLLELLPLGVVPTDITEKTNVLKAFQSGIAKEHRSNSFAAWTSYIKTVKSLTADLPDDEQLTPLFEKYVFTLFQQYLFPSTESSAWIVSENSEIVLTRAYFLCAAAPQKAVKSAFEQEWRRLSGELVQAMSISLPEQSKDYIKSQTAVSEVGDRWFTLEESVIKALKNDDADEVASTTKNAFVETSKTVVNRALEIISSRNGKPFGAAAVVYAALKYTPKICTSTPALSNSVESFLEQDMHKLLVSQSSSYIVKILFSFREQFGKKDVFESLWISAVDSLCALPGSANKAKAIQELVTNDSIAQLSQQHAKLQAYLSQIIYQAGQGDSQSHSLFETAIGYSVVKPIVVEDNMGKLISLLDEGKPEVSSAMSVLEFISEHSPKLIPSTSENYMELLKRLLALSEVSDLSVQERALTFKTRLAQSKYFTAQDRSPLLPILHILRSNLIDAGSQSLSTKTLVDLASDVLEDPKFNSIDVSPDISLWLAALQPLLSAQPDPSLSITNVLGGSVAIVKAPTGYKSTNTPPHRDHNGYSIAFRIASYTSHLLSNDKFIQNLPIEDQVNILYFSLLTLEFAKDQLSFNESNKLWASLASSSIDNDVQAFISRTQANLNTILAQDKSWRKDVPQAGWLKSMFGKPESKGTSELEPTTTIQGLLVKLLNESRGLTTTSFYSARILSTVLSTLIEAHGWQAVNGEDWLASLNVLGTFSQDTVLAATAVITGLKDALSVSKIINNMLNRLISDVASIKEADETTVQRLVLLNACLDVYVDEDLAEGLTIPAAATRIVFAVKQILDWIETPQRETDSLTAESCKVLQKLLAAMKDTYGSYWESSISICITVWQAAAMPKPAASLSTVHASLRLYSLLDNLKEPNDDLEEALGQLGDEMTEGLLELLKRPRHRENQPLQIVDELLCRLIAKRPSSQIKAPEELYHLVVSDNQMIQTAAFKILHDAIPAAQEKISFDVLLEKKDATLPAELLSLLLDAPSMHNFSDQQLLEFPSQIRGYLLSWLLVFESYPASSKVRNDYTEILKQGEYLDSLLIFMFDVLGHSAGNPVGLDRAGLRPEQITSYDLKLASSESDEKSMQWLLVHLYYLCLKLTPNMAKNWWMYCKSKQTRIAVESWTERYFSPLVIADTLEEVSKWAAEQPIPGPTDDEKELVIKISKPSREIFAGYEVDDTQIQAAVKFPTNYPLESITVEGIQRVAVSEKRWKNWLMATQGVIKFSVCSAIPVFNIISLIIFEVPSSPIITIY